MVALLKTNRRSLIGLLVGMLVLCACQGQGLGAGGTPTIQPTVVTGSISGATYGIAMPPTWNGTVILYSHGYITPGTTSMKPPLKMDPYVTGWFYAHGYALAASSYSTPTGWAVEQALHDQMALLDLFTQRYGQPKRTMAWGASMGGLISVALAEQYPKRFAGALSVCGNLAGSVATYNTILDAALTFKTLLAPNSPLNIVHITDARTNIQLAEPLLEQAQHSPQGRARLALVTAMMDESGWSDPLGAEPAPTDAATRLANQLAMFQSRGLSFAFGDGRVDIEQRAGGNSSWNTGVNYSQLLANSRNRDEVQALYHQAGLDLNKDLAALAHAPRIAPDKNALVYLQNNVTLTGKLQVPVVTLHTTGDTQAQVEQERAYADLVYAAGTQEMVRQLFLHRADHCTQTGAELLTGFQVLMQRIETGKWEETEQIQDLNRQAQNFGTDLNTYQGHQVPAAFIVYHPGPWLRPFNTQSVSSSSL
jgi:pimeloyl-ACP methyl ester carboxylesterase